MTHWCLHLGCDRSAHEKWLHALALGIEQAKNSRPLVTPSLLTVFVEQGFLWPLHNSTLGFSSFGSSFEAVVGIEAFAGCAEFLLVCAVCSDVLGFLLNSENGWLGEEDDFLLALLVPQAKHLTEPGLFSKVHDSQAQLVAAPEVQPRRLFFEGPAASMALF